MATIEQAVQLKIALKHSEPSIWRRVMVKSSITFFELHHTIQIAMGWENYHLFEFKVNDYRIGELDEEFADVDFVDSKVINCLNITLGEILPEIENFSYEYDFGDGWNHDILIEKTMPLEENAIYPRCIEGELNCPPEDCGGIPGYYHLLEIIKDKKHPEYKQMYQWLGGKFAPGKFDLRAANKFLEHIHEEMTEQENWENMDFEDDWEEGDDDFFDMFSTLPVKIINKSKHPLPEYESEASAGMDLRANLDKKITLNPLERAVVKTGLFIELPLFFEAQVRPRSGLAAKHGITVLNSPGTIDADYRGEIGVILVNLSNETFTIEDGDRIAQLVVAKHERVEWFPVEKLGDTDRGQGGFGSTGES